MDLRSSLFEKDTLSSDIFISLLSGITGIVFYCVIWSPTKIGMYFLSYFLVGAITTYSLKKFGFGNIEAFVGACIYNFIPYHYLCDHTVNSLSYFVIPVYMWMLALLVEKKPFNLLFCGIITFALPFVGMEFGIIWMVLLLWGWIYNRKDYVVSQSKKIGWIIVIGAAAIILGTWSSFDFGNGIIKGVEYTVGGMIDNGMKIWALFLPIYNHRIDSLAIFTQGVYEKMWVNSSIYNTLGIFCLIGFVISIIACFLENKNGEEVWLGKINVMCVLLWSTDCFLIIWAILEPFRSLGFDKVITVISFCSILCVLKFMRNFKNKFHLNKYIYTISLLFILVMALLDQTPNL